MLYTILRPVAWLIFKCLFFVSHKGKENLPSTGSYILASNHLSLIDPVFLGLGVSKRKVHYMAKAELFRNKFMAWFCRSLGAFPVKRGAMDVSAMKTAIDELTKGHIVGIFPQGKRVRESKISRYKSGFALMASKSNCLVVPAYIKTKNQRISIFRKVSVTFGKPMTLQDLGYSDGNTENLHLMAQRLMEETERLADVV